jgi:hypothetical protein
MREPIYENETFPMPQLLIWFLPLILFPLFCLPYALRTNLWGDEAFSLLYASDNWSWIAGDSHLPTYYWLLKHILNVLSDDNEALLRMLHVIPFIIGLILGILTIQRTFKHPQLIWLVSSIAITLSEYIYYATNLRMYSLLFMVEMAFVDAISRILAAKNRPSNYLLLWLAFSGLALMGTDYAGVIYYAAGVAFLLIRAIRLRQAKPFFVALIPILPALYLALKSLGNIQTIITWDLHSSQAISWNHLGDLIKWLYLACRPALDLVYLAPLPTALAITLPLLWLALLFYGAYKLFKQTSWRFENADWMIFIALLWLFFIPLGYSFTRLFLPSQFFMLVVIIWGIINSVKRIKLTGLIILSLLLLIDLKQIISPTFKLYNLIPYREIAVELETLSQQRGIKQILLSDNSYNTLSIQHYLQKNPEMRDVEVKRVGSDLLQRFPQLKEQKFLFVSHMDEDGHFVDITKILPGRSQKVASYISLEELPYNSLWKNRFVERSSQPYAVQIYVVSPS